MENELTDLPKTGSSLDTSKMKRSIFAIVLALSLTSSTTASLCQPLPENLKNPWYKPVPETEGKFKNLDPQIVFRVRASALPSAIRQLESVPFKSLSTREAQRLIGNLVKLPSQYHPYLVRGLYFNDGNGAFFLSRRNTTLLVEHSCLGRYEPMTKQPLVVFLTWKPTKLYVAAYVSA